MCKTFRFVLFLLLMVTGTASAQSVEDASLSADSVKQATASDYNALSEELSQVKSQLSKLENDKLWKRRKYWKFGMATPSMERTDGEAMTWKTDFSVFIQRGKTAYLHSKPIGGMVKLGIDYGFFDLSYAKLKLKTVGEDNVSISSPTYGGPNPDGFDDIVSDDPSGSVLSAMGINLGMHKIEYGLHVGPSVSVNPWKKLIVSAYFHVMPTASGIIADDTFSYGFGCAMAAGVSAAYKALSVGVEGVWSNIKYKQASFDEDEDDYDYDYDYEPDDASGSIFATKDFKLKQKGPRFYIALRF